MLGDIRMSCKTCQNFPTQSPRFEELGISIERHGTVYRCRDCGTLFEQIAEERAIRFTPRDELRKFYPEVDCE